MHFPPLLVTLGLAHSAFERFEAERRAWYPPERNRVPAHVMFFHHLPGAEEAAIRVDLRALVARQSFAINVTGVRFFGSGVAYVLESRSLNGLHASMASRWDRWLIAQDRQGFRPHIVIQNKVDRATARTTHDALGASFEPFAITAIGVDLWRYLDGPWELVERFAFASSASPNGDR